MGTLTLYVTYVCIIFFLKLDVTLDCVLST